MTPLKLSIKSTRASPQTPGDSEMQKGLLVSFLPLLLSLRYSFIYLYLMHKHSSPNTYYVLSEGFIHHYCKAFLMVVCKCIMQFKKFKLSQISRRIHSQLNSLQVRHSQMPQTYHKCQHPPVDTRIKQMKSKSAN